MLKASIQQLLAIYFGLTFSQATQAERPHDQVEQRQPENKPTSADLYGDPLPPGAIARIGTVRFRHGTWIEALAYSPDGRTIAAGDKDGYIRMWEARTGK